MTERRKTMGVDAKEVELVSDDVCPECDDIHLFKDHHRGEVVCDDCGLVVSEAEIDNDPERTAYNAGESDFNYG
jgi:transcription initiation factor TFIIB